MTAALQALQDQYDLLTAELPKLLEACNGDATRMDQINTQYVTCSANYNTCVNTILNDGDPAVKGLVTQMNQAQAAIKAKVAVINDIAGVINTITTAVQFGTSLTSLAAKV